jgi:hypothetical protein
MTADDLLQFTHDLRDSGIEVRIFVQHEHPDNFVLKINNVGRYAYRNPSDHDSGGDMFAELFDRIMMNGEENYNMNITVHLNRE